MTNPGPLIDLSFDHIDLWSRSSDKGPVSSSRSRVRLIVWAGTSGKSLSRQVRQGVVVGFFTGCEGDLGKTCGDAGESGQSSWLVWKVISLLTVFTLVSKGAHIAFVVTIGPHAVQRTAVPSSSHCVWKEYPLVS